MQGRRCACQGHWSIAIAQDLPEQRLTYVQGSKVLKAFYTAVKSTPQLKQQEACCAFQSAPQTLAVGLIAWGPMWLSVWSGPEWSVVPLG